MSLECSVHRQRHVFQTVIPSHVSQCRLLRLMLCVRLIPDTRGPVIGDTPSCGGIAAVYQARSHPAFNILDTFDRRAVLTSWGGIDFGEWERDHASTTYEVKSLASSLTNVNVYSQLSRSLHVFTHSHARLSLTDKPVCPFFVPQVVQSPQSYSDL